MEITDGLVVTIEYTLKDDDGQIVESSEERGPVSFTMGGRRMLPGLEMVIRGMKVGEQKSGQIPPGELVPREFTGSRLVGHEEFPEGLEPKVGQRFAAKGLDGAPVLFEITKVGEAGVVVQLLHYLHEHAVAYDVKVLAARKANVPPPPPPPLDFLPDMTEHVVEGSLETLAVEPNAESDDPEEKRE